MNRRRQTIPRPPRLQPPRVPSRLRAAVRRAWQERWPCLLCGAVAVVAGCFVPSDPPRWGAPPGWRAGAAYTLCARCVRLPDRATRTEAVLWSRRDHLAAPWN